MKNIKPLYLASAIAAVGLFTTGISGAAFIIATDGSLGLGNYAYTGPGGTVASGPSGVSAGTLPATTDVPPTFFTLNAIYGGNGTTDEYTFTYSPGADADNTSFPAGTLYNSRGALSDLTSTGLAGGGAGVYNVYRLHPQTSNVSGGNTTYSILLNGGLQLTQVINQNAANLATGENIGRWELIGSVGVPNASDTVAVTMTPDASTFVSMRASGIMFEYVEPIPEPASVMLLSMGAAVFAGRRRR